MAETINETRLPNGLTISVGGTLAGTVALAGPYSFQAKVVDSNSLSTTRQLTLLVSTGLPLTILTQSLPACVVNVSCSTQIVGAGGGLAPGLVKQGRDHLHQRGEDGIAGRRGDSAMEADVVTEEGQRLVQ